MPNAPRPQPTSSRLFACPKVGKSEAEYEDACAMNPATGIYVMTDGASDSVFARLWAELLAQRFVDARPSGRDLAAWEAWIAPAQRAWETAVHAEPLPWYVESKIREGAFATFLALAIRPHRTANPGGQWAALAVGDTCLFHIPHSARTTISPAAGGFPVSRASDFGIHPSALSTRPSANHHLWPALKVVRGNWHAGDIFMLATDALAEWIMREIVPEHGWSRLLALADTADDAAFRQLVTEQRSCGRLRNDDVTLLIVRTAPADHAAQGEDVNVALAG